MMLTRLVAAVLLCGATLPAFAAAEVTVAIDRIEPNRFITGHLNGLSAAERPKHKVVVYVHTDRWYVHPYASQGEGKSWATIADDGTWRIETVQREFKADKIAALVVERGFAEPAKLDSLEGIAQRARTVKTLQGSNDFGKL